MFFPIARYVIAIDIEWQWEGLWDNIIHIPPLAVLYYENKNNFNLEIWI